MSTTTVVNVEMVLLVASEPVGSYRPDFLYDLAGP